jgi:hypothetical protein
LHAQPRRPDNKLVGSFGGHKFRINIIWKIEVLCTVRFMMHYRRFCGACTVWFRSSCFVLACTNAALIGIQESVTLTSHQRPTGQSFRILFFIKFYKSKAAWSCELICNSRSGPKYF